MSPNPPNPLLTERSRTALRHLVNDDVGRARDLLEKLILREYTRQFTNDKNTAMKLLENIREAFLSLPMLGWRNEAGTRFNHMALADDVDKLIDWLVAQLEPKEPK